MNTEEQTEVKDSPIIEKGFFKRLRRVGYLVSYFILYFGLASIISEEVFPNGEAGIFFALFISGLFVVPFMELTNAMIKFIIKNRPPKQTFKEGAGKSYLIFSFVMLVMGLILVFI